MVFLLKSVLRAPVCSLPPGPLLRQHRAAALWCFISVAWVTSILWRTGTKLAPDAEVSPLIIADILRIDNLWQFENLRKLQLDNNVIERIEGLEKLTHLVWLGKAPFCVCLL